jgi:hypothetical protein
VNRDAKTQTALIALARNRRMQRALAHAQIHRDAPLPTLRHSLGFMMATACTADDASGLGHTMSLVGVAHAEGVAYVVEELGGNDAPIAYRLWLRGPRQGHLVPIHAWYSGFARDPLPGARADGARGQAQDASEIRARIAAIAATLDPVPRSTTEAWMLSTRVVQRRALRVANGGVPLRKFALQLRVEPVSGHGASGHTTVTAFLRPSATLAEVWALAPGVAAARVTFTGIPNGVGLPKDTVVLLSE